MYGEPDCIHYNSIWREPRLITDRAEGGHSQRKSWDIRSWGYLVLTPLTQSAPSHSNSSPQTGYKSVNGCPEKWLPSTFPCFQVSIQCFVEQTVALNHPRTSLHIQLSLERIRFRIFSLFVRQTLSDQILICSRIKVHNKWIYWSFLQDFNRTEGRAPDCLRS